jgi:hypothetical protein
MTQEKVRTNTRRDPLTDNAHYRLFENCLKDPDFAPSSVTTLMGMSTFSVSNEEFFNTLKADLGLRDERHFEGEISFITNRNLHYEPVLGPGNTIGSAYLTILIGGIIHQFTVTSAKSVEPEAVHIVSRKGLLSEHQMYVSTDKTPPSSFGKVIGHLIRSEAYSRGEDI